MIILYDVNGNKIPISDYEDFCVTHRTDGCDEMSFCLDTSHDFYKELYEEAKIVANGNEWLIKKIDDDKIDCELNFDFLKTRFYENYNSGSSLIENILSNHLPSGWTFEGAGLVSIRRTIDFDYCTDYDVVYRCMSVFDVRFVWNIPDKILKVVVPEAIIPSGEYVTSELNLKSLSFKGDTTEFATRLYAFGEEGMTMEEAIVDGQRYGLKYVDNNSYSNKIVCAYLTDDRYTVPENLYAAAVELLATLANPVRSYECNVIDLAKQNDEYFFLDFRMHKKITLVDVERGIKVEHQIVEYVEYPDEPERNKVTLSCVPKTIQESVNNAISSLRYDISNDIKNRFDAYDARVYMATAMLTGSFGSYLYHDEEAGDLFMMDNPNPALAQTVWRWNKNGFGKSSNGINGPYTTALTFDDQFITDVINSRIINADCITAGTMTAERVRAGVLSSNNNTTYFDLTNSEICTTGSKDGNSFKTYLRGGDIEFYGSTSGGQMGKTAKMRTGYSEKTKDTVYTCDGSTTVFKYTGSFISIWKSLDRGTNYSSIPQSNYSYSDSDGEVTMTTPPSKGVKIKIVSSHKYKHFALGYISNDNSHATDGSSSLKLGAFATSDDHFIDLLELSGSNGAVFGTSSAKINAYIQGGHIETNVLKTSGEYVTEGNAFSTGLKHYSAHSFTESGVTYEGWRQHYFGSYISQNKRHWTGWQTYGSDGQFQQSFTSILYDNAEKDTNIFRISNPNYTVYVNFAGGQNVVFAKAYSAWNQNLGLLNLYCDDVKLSNGTSSPTSVKTQLSSLWENKAGTDVYTTLSDKAYSLSSLESDAGSTWGAFQIITKPDDNGNRKTCCSINANTSHVVSFKHFYGSNNYCTIEAAKFDVKSVEDIKKNISSAQTDALSLLKNSVIYNYDYIDEDEGETTEITTPISIDDNGSSEVGESGTGESEEEEETLGSNLGFVIGRETPEEVISEDGTAVNLYSFTSLTWLACQQLLERIKTLEARVDELENPS